MYAYLTPEQNELLQMSERLDIHFEPTEDGRQIAKYQALASEFSQVRQEMQVKEQQEISVTLPVCTEKNLLALIKLELVISEADMDK